MKNLSIPKNIKNNIKTIGFGVYEYIDFFELQKTIIRDYANVVVNYNWLFFVIVLFSTFLLRFEGFVFSFLIIYLGILVYLLIKLIWRIKLFIALNKVIVTKKGIIAGDSVFGFNEKGFLSYLKLFEKEFDEFLFEASRLDIILKQKKEQIYNLVAKNMSTTFKLTRDGDLRGVIFGFLISVLYSASVMFFYYLGYIFIFIFSVLIIGILRLYFHFFGKIEIKIYNQVISISSKLNKANDLNHIIEEKFKSFSEGKIIDLGYFVEEKFNDFYNFIRKIFIQVNQVEKDIPRSKFDNYIDLDKLNLYLKEKFNEPINGMIGILEQYISMIEKQKKELKALQTSKSEFKSNLALKEITLNNQLKIMKQNLEKMKKMKL